MRKLLAALSAALVLGALAPIASQALVADHRARLDEGLTSQLASAAPADRLLVMVHGTSREAAVRAVGRAGLEQLTVLESIGVPAALGTPAQIESLSRQPGVTHVEADAPIELSSDTALTATRVDEARAPGSAVLQADGTPFTGAGRSIAVVDGGVDGTHPMFQRDGESTVVRNFKIACHSLFCGPGAASDVFMVDVTDKGNDSDTISAGGHGTHVASIAAGVPTPFGDRMLSGTAPGADVVAFSVGASLSIFSANVALDWIARHHADPCEDGSCPPITVINNSYGPTGGGEFNPNSATALISARLVTDEVVVVWANGNGDATNVGGDGSDNRSNPEGQNPLPGIISVANYDDANRGTRDGTLNSSSSRGQAGRPGTWPDVSAPGTDITAACRPYLSICTSGETDPDFGTISGTSMAAPHVAGIVALLQEARPGITPREVEDALEDTAHRFTFGGAYAPDPTNATTPSSFDKGHGLVDAVRALDDVLHATVASSSGECLGLIGTDATDEPQPYAVTLVNGPYDPGVDLTSVELVGDPVANTATLTIGVKDLTALPPSASGGIYIEARYLVAGKPHTMHAIRDAGGPSFDVDDVSDGVTGTFDVDTDTITVTAPSSAYVPAIGGSNDISGVEVQSGRLNGVLILWSDAATAGCGTIDVGGAVIPEAEPDGAASAGSPYEFSGATSTSVNPLDGFAPSVTVEGEAHEVRRVDVTAAPGETLTFTVTCDVLVDDWDISLLGPDGNPIGTGSGTAPGASGNNGCDELITVANAPSGVYTATVTTFLTAHGTFDATIAVS